MRACLVVLFVIAACGPRSRWVVVDVRSAGAPVGGATVSAVCTRSASDARLSDEDGLATLEIHDKVKQCTVTAAHEGLRTAQTADVAVCRDRATCAPLTVELEAP